MHRCACVRGKKVETRKERGKENESCTHCNERTSASRLSWTTFARKTIRSPRKSPKDIRSIRPWKFFKRKYKSFFLEKKGNETILSSPKIKVIEKSFSSATRAWNMRVVFVHRSGIKSGENRRGRRLVGAPRYIVRAIYRNDDDRKGRRVPRWDNVAIRV